MKIEIDNYPVNRWWIDGRHARGGYRPLKLYLIDLIGVCYHCGVTVHDYVCVDGEIAPDDMATIDHLLPRPWRKRYQVVRKVLCCYECNAHLNKHVQRRKDPNAFVI